MLNPDDFNVLLKPPSLDHQIAITQHKHIMIKKTHFLFFNNEYYIQNHILRIEYII